jgi:hypothetical protein
MFDTINLTDLVLFVAMLGVFIFLTRRALATQEYTGYGLGLLLGLFFVVIYNSLFPNTTLTLNPDGTPVTNVVPTFTFFQLALPTLCGVFTGAGLMVFFGLARMIARRYTILVATLTTFNVVVLFLMVVGDLATRRMVGIFGMALIISVILCAVAFGRPDMRQEQNFAQALNTGEMPAIPPQGQPQMSPLEQMRQRFRR